MINYHTYKIGMCVFLYPSFGRTAGRIFTILFGGKGSVSLKLNNYFDVFDVTHVKHKKIF